MKVEFGPMNNMTIDPAKVLIATPTHSGDIVAECAAGLIQAGGLYGSWFPLRGCSAINLARNLIVQQFRESSFEWLVWLDADIGFTRQDFLYLMEGDQDCVVAAYAKKDGSGVANKFGLGFARIHKSVYEKLDGLMVNLPEGGEAPGVNYFVWGAQMVYDVHPSFADLTHSWLGEDHGFWKLAQRAGVSIRIESRTRLKHFGRTYFEMQSLYFADEAGSQDAK